MPPKECNDSDFRAAHEPLRPRAAGDLEAIWDYIAVEKCNPDGANRQLRRFADRLAILATQPLMGELRSDLRPGLRVFSIDAYVVFYYPSTDGIEVAAVIHGARDIESVFRSR